MRAHSQNDRLIFFATTFYFSEDKESRRIADVLLAQDKLFHDLLSNIADEEATQVKAFQALQLEKDALYVNITNQV